MPRRELAAILSDLVRRKAITLAEARAVLARFDRGQLDSLPLSEDTDEQEQGDFRNFHRWTIAYLLVLLLVNGNTLQRPLSTLQRTRARKELRSNFEGRMSVLAGSVASGQLPIGQWQTEMRKSIAGYARQMASAGAGQLTGVDVQNRIDAHLKLQWPYLRGFATQILARQIGERPMSEAWIAARARKYGGTGWSAYFAGQGSVATPGYVDVWLSRDDPHVCFLCSPRHQTYFLPSVGPYPGDPFACLGECRCVREPEYIPNIYADLVGSRSDRIHPVKRSQLARTKRTA